MILPALYFLFYYLNVARIRKVGNIIILSKMCKRKKFFYKSKILMKI